MKKRVRDNEIQKARNSSRILFLMLFGFFILLFVGFGVMVAMDVDILSLIAVPKEKISITKPISQDKNNEEDGKEESSILEIDPQNSNIQKYFQYVKVTGENVCEDGSYSNKSRVLVGQLSEKCKFSLASNLYRNFIHQGLEGRLYIMEKDVKEAYETLYGDSTYKSQESIPVLYKTQFLHNGDYYFTDTVAPEEDWSLTSYEKVIKATKDGDMLDITSAVVYYETVLAILCKDNNCENILEPVQAGTEFGDAFFRLYVDHYQDKLYQYIYHFELDNSGFYRYVGYDRTNE